MDGDEVGRLRVDAECFCGERSFALRFNREELVGLVTCSAGHHSLLLDSREYWTDVVQNGRPKQSKCGCRGKSFAITFAYELRLGGEVRTIGMLATCVACWKPLAPVLIDIKYSPTQHLIERPLDRIEKPWELPRRVELTGYWRPEDLREVTTYLVDTLRARVFVEDYGKKPEQRPLNELNFLPELRANLYFTTSDDRWIWDEFEPQRNAPVLKVSGGTHMMFGEIDLNDLSTAFFLHYVKFATEVVRSGKIEKQPGEFLEFACAAQAWLTQHFANTRCKTAIDNPVEYLRLAPFLDR